MASRRRLRRTLGPGVFGKSNIGMNNLPDEILLEVVRDIDDEDLFRLGMTCGRLNSFALPFLFQKYKLNAASSSHLILDLGRMPRFILTAVRTALFLKDVSGLSVYNLFRDEACITQEVIDLRVLVQQWPKLSHLELDVSLFGQDWGRLVNISKWKGDVIALLDAVASSQCTSFHVTAKQIIYHLSIETSVRRAMDILNPPNPYRVMPAARHVTTLSSLKLHSHLLFLHHIYPTTLSILSGSSATLSSLSLDCTLPAEMWIKLLQSLTLPSLTDFTFVPYISRLHASFALKEVAAFVYRHPLIKVLAIHVAVLSSDDLSQTPSPWLPKLRFLTAHPTIIPWFLTRARKVPMLANVKLLLDKDVSTDVIRDALDVISALNGDVHLSFTIRSALPLLNWIKYCVRAKTRRQNIMLSLVNVKKFTLNLYALRTSDGYFKATLAPWLALFPSLHTFDLKGEIQEEDWKNHGQDLIELIAKACPNLQSIRYLDHQVYLRDPG